MCGMPDPVLNRFRATPTDLGFDVTSLHPDVHILRARSTFWPAPGNIVVIQDGDGVALIDCGFGTEEARDGLGSALASLGLDLRAVHTVLVTHPHLDHAGGIGLLDEKVRVLGPSRLGVLVADAHVTAELIFPAVVRDLAPDRANLEIVEHFRIDCGVAVAPVATTVIEPDDVIALGRTRWLAIPTPGHEDGMYSYFEPTLGILACSDIIAAKGTAIPWYAPGGGGTAGYLGGLARLADLEVDVAVRGHGTTLFGADSVTEAVGVTANRIRHRTTAIRRAVTAHPLSFADLEQEIYNQRVYGVIPWAASVLATHLLEGIENGSLRRDADLFAAAG